MFMHMYNESSSGLTAQSLAAWRSLRRSDYGFNVSSTNSEQCKLCVNCS